jgi:hypothetical protein
MRITVKARRVYTVHPQAEEDGEYLDVNVFAGMASIAVAQQGGYLCTGGIFVDTETLDEFCRQWLAMSEGER